MVSGHGGPARSSDGARFKPNTKTLLSGGGGTPPAASSSPQLDTIMEDHDPFDELWAAEDASFANASVRHFFHEVLLNQARDDIFLPESTITEYDASGSLWLLVSFSLVTWQRAH